MKLTPGSVAAACLYALPLVSAQELKIVPSDGVAVDRFGNSVALSGNTAIVAAIGNDDLGFIAGSAYLFDVTTGQQIAKLLASDGGAGDGFGWSVGISGAVAIVGAPEDDDPYTAAGSAYLFDTTNGQQLAKILASDGELADEFGHGVAISGGTAVIGAWGDADAGFYSGSAYLVDVSDPTAPVEFAKLQANDSAAADYFGYSVAISGTTAIIGAHGDDDSGAAYLFDTTTGTQTAKLVANDGAPGDSFGFSVAIYGTTAIVGAFGDDDSGSQSGSAYLFDTNTGQQTAKLAATGGAFADYFGWSVGIGGGVAIVGAYKQDELGMDAGAVYLFDVSSGEQTAKIRASDGSAGDYFGVSVGISASTILVGAEGNDDSGLDSGSAYRVETSFASWTSRSGSLGLNPLDYTCSDAPVLNATWSTQVSTTPGPGSSTLGTFVAVGLGGPAQGVPLFGHELLILPPFLSFSGFGVHDFPIPLDSTLSGLAHSWQGARLEAGSGGGFSLVLTNALDVIYGL